MEGYWRHEQQDQKGSEYDYYGLATRLADRDGRQQGLLQPVVKIKQELPDTNSLFIHELN